MPWWVKLVLLLIVASFFVYLLHDPKNAGLSLRHVGAGVWGVLSAIGTAIAWAIK